VTDPWQEFVVATTQRLTAGGIDPAECRVEVRLIIAHALGLTREQMILRRDPPSSAETAQVEALLERRLRREPLAYIVGTRWFYGLEFTVGPGVLIPRPETELLVEWVLDQFPTDSTARVADIGTGSGCIAVSIAKHRPTINVDAIDISADALTFAARNAQRHGVADRVRFHCGDLFQAIDPGTVYDAMVSNPPYIPDVERPLLAPEVAAHEPSTALFGPGTDGLGLYRQLALEASRYLRPGGAIAVEVGAGQAPAVVETFERSGWTHIVRIPDLAGIERVVTAIAPDWRTFPHTVEVTHARIAPETQNEESA